MDCNTEGSTEADEKSLESREVVMVESDGEKVENQTVTISMCGSTPLLWRVAEIKKCREEVGVIGSLVGSLARQPRQNVRLGRPLEILQEEARLLEETGKATALKHKELSEHKESRSDAVKLYHARLERSYVEQCSLALEDKKAVLQRVINEKKNDHKGNAGAEQAVRERLKSLEKSFSFPRSAMAVQLCTARAGFSHCPEKHAFLAADWPRLRDKRSETRFQVYKDLRSKGFYLTAAGKFGGDYLVYPGDPLRFHAHFIALCLPMDEKLPVCDVLAIARLGSNVKKTVLLCSPQDTSEEEDVGEKVVYSSLQWSGMV
ncbi:tRNA-splicing endonuclease subunit Sen34 isoform X1 [Silurus asotus]|uniref:tRNA-splicing endonuclease subunit Sen34 n=1 Tax=Silurus asotus TaxID=30991 RepID=A0AAD5AWL6_SILAS|nr:tRNA-splicing endonuclease subunit Sen34 isoform X1 [Silurus asotus]